MIGTNLEVIRNTPPNMNKYTKALPVLSHINQTKNTWQACKLCRGTRTVVIRSSVLGTLTHKKCLHCNGTGMMFNEWD
jgi:DnaJ-class molecular chaperone